jgi:hypothetical protein
MNTVKNSRLGSRLFAAILCTEFGLRTSYLGIFQIRLAVACSLPLYKGTASSLIYRNYHQTFWDSSEEQSLNPKKNSVGPNARDEYNLTLYPL